MASDNIHKNHRQRMRAKVLRAGLDSLSDHEVLEVLLYYALPRRDTNTLAHQLLEHYGSLAGVLDAAPRDLAKQPGLGENSAFLLHFASQLTARYQQSKNRSRPVYGSTYAFESYVASLFCSEVREVAYLLCLDKGRHLTSAVKLAEGSQDYVAVDVRDVVRLALSYSAESVVLAHNHPGGISRPSNDDLDLTLACISALKLLGIELLDHLIVCNGTCFSFVAYGYMAALLNKLEQSKQSAKK